ncbi:hypothetical protein HZS_3628 [Henneguya salminicola]|nr:hypothetical protein HZS_3628 [Henneguya salminicola]
MDKYFERNYEGDWRDYPDLTNCDTKTFLPTFIAELKDVLSTMNIYKDSCLVLGNEIFWIEENVIQKFVNCFNIIKALPFYSRNLNPAETAFSKIKILARKLLFEGKPNQNISEIFKIAISQITQEDCIEYLNNFFSVLNLSKIY